VAKDPEVLVLLPCGFDLARKPRLDSLWANLLKSGGRHSGHIHPHSVISGTFYVEAPSGSGTIRFEDPRLPQMMAAPPRARDAPDELQPFVNLQPRPGLPDGVMVGGADQVDMHLACLNSHDGRTAFRTVVTPVRVVCANTERAALAHNSGIYKVNHTSQITASVGEARKALELTLAYRDEFADAVERMINTPMSVGQFRIEAKKIIRPEGREVSERSEKADAKLLSHLTGLFEGPLNAGIARTRWAAYNAFTDHLDHHAKVLTGGENPATVRARRALLGGADDTKTKAFRAFPVPA